MEFKLVHMQMNNSVEVINISRIKMIDMNGKNKSNGQMGEGRTMSLKKNKSRKRIGIWKVLLILEMKTKRSGKRNKNMYNNRKRYSNRKR